jgi:integrase
MKISFNLSGTKQIKKLSIRIYHNRLDLSSALNVMLTDSEWDSTNETIIGNPEVTIALQELKTDILRGYNKDFCGGKIIDKAWLQNIIKTTFMRPKSENNFVIPTHTIYVSDFSTWWLENHAAEWKVSARKTMDIPAQNQYKKFVETLTDYETIIGEKLQLRSITKKNIESFIDWLETENYQTSTIERNIGRLRFFLNRATEMNYEVSQAFKERIYFEPENDVEGIYLNEGEIQKIIDKDFSYDENLNCIKQNFLISLHSGLRISDFMKLDISNIKEGMITLKTQKTKQKIVVPVHPIVEGILKDNFGFLPKKVSSSEYNKQIKVICQVCEIDNLVFGKVFDSKLKRKVTKYYKKHELVTSHIGRKSFLSNNYEKVSPEVINSVLGWSKNSKMATKYNKTTKVEYAEIMKKQWNQ